MAKIALISCVSRKGPYKSKASELYISPLFRKNLKYAKSIGVDKIFILSAKYGLLDLDDEIEPYNTTLNEMNRKEKEEWASVVLDKLIKVSDLKKDEFIFLAGENYRQFLIPQMAIYKVPMQGLGIGKQLKWLTENTHE